MPKLEVLPVIFRAEKSGDFKGQVTAVFPTLPWSGTEMTCMGKHGTDACSWAWYLQRTRAAKPAEYADLLREVQDFYGSAWAGEGDVAYSVKVYPRITTPMRRKFDDEVRAMRARGLI